MFVSLRPLPNRPLVQRYASLCSKASLCPTVQSVQAPRRLHSTRRMSHAAAAPQAALSKTEDPRKKHFWTTKDMPDQSGKTVIVTGASSGMGWYCAKASHLDLQASSPHASNLAGRLGDCALACSTYLVCVAGAGGAWCTRNHCEQDLGQDPGGCSEDNGAPLHHWCLVLCPAFL